MDKLMKDGIIFSAIIILALNMAPAFTDMLNVGFPIKYPNYLSCSKYSTWECDHSPIRYWLEMDMYAQAGKVTAETWIILLLNNIVYLICGFGISYVKNQKGYVN